MTLPTAYNPISLGQIQGEFGGANPIALAGEYYRGAGYTTNNNINVPTGPAPATIALSNFYSGWRGILVTITYYRDAADTNAFYLSANGFPTVTISTPYNRRTSYIDSYIAPNVTYNITANTPWYQQAYQDVYDPNTDEYYTELINGMWLEDRGGRKSDWDYNDLQFYPGAGTIFYDGGYKYRLDV